LNGQNMKTTIPLQNIHCEGCFRNVEAVLRLCDGVTEVTIDRHRLEAVVEFDLPTTVEELRAELDLGGYLAAAQEGSDKELTGQV